MQIDTWHQRTKRVLTDLLEMHQDLRPALMRLNTDGRPAKAHETLTLQVLPPAGLHKIDST